MPIIVRLDVMLAQRKMRSKELAEAIGITEANLSLLKSGKVRGVRFDTLSRICEVLQCQPGDLLVHEAGEHGSAEHDEDDEGLTIRGPRE
ncbi:helix-turn-helix transcriptional regulator [Roseateles sp. SL47]|uniref:helix-turn-helix domain-containing protein n=1 Tax=Roseateles sp. SL47 TaxID=2995138 RepID=UPI00226E3BBC|nr:helix-turn-helix transcriptional regulator [Roseateles sp. SL47]WAC72644.1 helix-turn-helix transcriptional regulator [Roseateles sp. SL47]